MKKSLFFCALAGFAFASCSNDSETAAGNDSQIKLQASLQQVNSLTRAPFLNDPSLNNPLTTDILIANASTDFTAATLYNTGAIAATFTSSNGPGLTTACMWPANATTNLYFVGLAPTGAWGASAAAITVATANGYTDLMTTGAAVAKSKSNGTVPLTFQHAQILVKLYVRAENATAKADWGNIKAATSFIKSVNFTDQDVANDVDIPEVMTLTLATGSIAATNTANAGFNFRTIDATKVQETYTDALVTDLLNTNLYYDRETAFGYVMLPISTGASLKSLIVQLESSNATVGVREARINMVGAAPGSAYAIHLTLKENGRIVFDPVTVTQWSVVSNPTGTIGG